MTGSIASLGSLPATPDLLRSHLVTELRHERLGVDDMRHIGRVFFNDERAFALYGRDARELDRDGCAILGRSGAEACVDVHARGVGMVARALTTGAAPPTGLTVIDPFLGTGNLAFHVARACGADVTVGFESDARVLACTAANLDRLAFASRLHGGSFLDPSPAGIGVPDSGAVLLVVDPPWGPGGFTFERGLDLRRTDPPVPAILATARERLPHRVVHCLVKSYESVDEAGLAETCALLEEPTFATIGDLPGGANVGYVAGRLA